MKWQKELVFGFRWPILGSEAYVQTLSGSSSRVLVCPRVGSVRACGRLRDNSSSLCSVCKPLTLGQRKREKLLPCQKRQCRSGRNYWHCEEGSRFKALLWVSQSKSWMWVSPIKMSDVTGSSGASVSLQKICSGPNWSSPKFNQN